MIQEYINSSLDTPLETVFFFPTDINFALSKIKIDYYHLDKPSKLVSSAETVIEEIEKAKKKYEDAVADGNNLAVLATHAAPHDSTLIKINMGSFPPRSKAILTCFMYSTLDSEDGSYCFRFPMAYIPKYLFGNKPVA